MLQNFTGSRWRSRSTLVIMSVKQVFIQQCSYWLSLLITKRLVINLGLAFFESRSPSWFQVVYIPVQIQCDFSRWFPSTALTHWMRYDSRLCTGKVQTHHKYCNLNVIMAYCDHVRADAHVRHCEISKMLISNWLMPTKNTLKNDLFFSQTRSAGLKYLPKWCPYMLIYSALHIMQWFSLRVKMCLTSKSEDIGF